MANPHVSSESAADVNNRTAGQPQGVAPTSPIPFCVLCGSFSNSESSFYVIDVLLSMIISAACANFVAKRSPLRTPRANHDSPLQPEFVLESYFSSLCVLCGHSSFLGLRLCRARLFVVKPLFVIDCVYALLPPEDFLSLLGHFGRLIQNFFD